jgi:GntR family transcriptional regulator/MocR family aminotransferase
LPNISAERAVLTAAAERDVALDGLERHHAAAPTTFGVALGYAGHDRGELERGLSVVKTVLAGAERTRGQRGGG